MALPVTDGGLGIPVPASNTAKEYEASSTITCTLVSLICNQQQDDEVEMMQKQLRREMSRKRRRKQQEEATTLKQSLPSESNGIGLGEGSLRMVNLSPDQRAGILPA